MSFNPEINAQFAEALAGKSYQDSLNIRVGGQTVYEYVASNSAAKTRLIDEVMQRNVDRAILGQINATEAPRLTLLNLQDARANTTDPDIARENKR